MPREVTEVKKFLILAKGDEKKETQKVIFIKENKKISKFKLRGKKYLYTFKTADKVKAAKLLSSLPSNITQVKIGAKKVATKKKGKK